MPKKGRRRKQGRRPDQETKNRDLSPRGDRQSPKGTEQANGSWKFHAAALLIICSLGAAIYSNTLGGDFIFDDVPNIYENPFITHVTELDWQRLYEAGFKSTCSTRPVANISFALNHYFGGLDVTGYHWVNIAIHLACGILVYFLASITFRLFFRLQHRETPVSDRAIAWMALFGACLFVAHPLQTQAVSYIVQRMTSMATMFYLLALLLYIYGRLSGSIRRRWVLWAGCLISWLLALGSKEIAITMPPLLLLYEWYFFQNLSKAWLRGSLKYFLPLAVVTVVVALLFLGTSPWDRILSGYDRRDFTLGERVLTQPRVLIHYISLVACPLPSRLNLLHHVSTSRSLFEPITTLLSFLTIAGVGGLAVYLARRQRLLSFCLLWFFLNLALESSVIALEMVFEHRLYLPMFAIALAVPYGVYCLLSKRAAVAGLLGLTIIVALGTGTYVRNQLWQDKIALWTDVIDKNPLAPRAHFNLGHALAGQGNVVEAIKHYHHALRINPDYAGAHNNLGLALAGQGNVVEAIKHYHHALRIKPDSAQAHFNLGNALAVQGNVDEAIEHIRQALRINPDYAGAHNNLGNVLIRQGKLDEAIDHYHHALRINPNDAGAHNNLGHALAGQGNVVEAIKYYRDALRINPDYARAHYNLGHALAGQGNVVEAIKHFRQVLRINPDNARAHYNLGNALAGQGNVVEAIKYYRDALRINPDYAGAHNKMGLALAGQGKVVQAIEHFRQALRIKPNDAGTHNNLGNALASQGNVVEAIEHFRQALRSVGPTSEHHSHNNLGNALARQGKLKEAIEHFHHALRINPNDEGAHLNLGNVLMRQGKLDEAIDHYHHALRIKPDYAIANNNLGVTFGMQAATYAEAGRLDEAIKTASQAIVAATAAGNEKLARDLRRQAALYRQAVPSRKPIE